MFVGTPHFGVPSLKALAGDRRFLLAAAVTKPDKKFGRGQRLREPEVKSAAKEIGIPVYQPERIGDAEAAIRAVSPDLMVVAAYAHIVPERILALPTRGCVNIHGSLLPAYRGSSCIQAAILNGDENTGVSFMLMDKGLDTGPILKQFPVKIGEQDNAGDLYAKLAELAASRIGDVLDAYASGALSPLPQDESLASMTKALKKEDGHIDWLKDASYIERFVRAMSPWPGAFSFFAHKGKMVRLQFLSLEALSGGHGQVPGTLYELGGRLLVAAGQGYLSVERLRLEGKKESGGREFLAGYGSSLPAGLR
jgi:methionyl-tRNA formyltransferase